MKIFKASYYGFLVGDAMGVPIESYDRELLMKNPVTTMLGFGSANVPEGSWSSASSMMIATMDSIATKPLVDYKDLADKLLAWISYSKYTSIETVFGVGQTTLKAIERYRNGAKPLEAGMEGINYNGNGSLNRMLPIAYYAHVKKLTEAEIIDLVCDISSITHRHEISCIGCYIYTRYMMFLLEGYDKYISYTKIKELDYSAFSNENLDEYRRILNDNLINYPLNDISSDGYVVHTLEAVIWCLNNTETFEESIIGAINLGGDTDTIAALTGALAGIIYGYEKIPKKWISALQKRDYIKWMCTAYLKALSNLK